jgi:hypothetical protein
VRGAQFVSGGDSEVIRLLIMELGLAAKTVAKFGQYEGDRSHVSGMIMWSWLGPGSTG